MRAGLLALSVGVGPKVMNELIEEELTQLVGPKGKNDRARGAKRHGSRRAQVVLGGRKVPARRPRPRTANGKEELKLRTFSHFASEDLLQEQTVERVLAGLSTRQLPRCLEPTATADRSVSRSAVSRRFVKRTGPALYSLRVGLGGERRRHRRHVLGWTVGGANGVKPGRRVLQSRSRRRPELARTTRG